MTEWGDENEIKYCDYAECLDPHHRFIYKKNKRYHIACWIEKRIWEVMEAHETQMHGESND